MSSMFIQFPPGMLHALDSFRRQQADFPSRSEAIRRLVGEGLAGRGLWAPDDSEEGADTDT